MIPSHHKARAAVAAFFLAGAAVVLLLAAAAALLVAAAAVSRLAASIEWAAAPGGGCESRAAVVERLAEQYGETLQSTGLNADQRLMEVYASGTTGTWTIVVTDPDGTACMIEAGEMWENRAEPPGKDA